MVSMEKDNGTPPPTGWRDHFNLILNQGGPGFCHFTVTNLCDAHCAFCNFAVGNLKSRDIRSVSCEEGLESIDILYRNGMRYIVFVGGEPLLHKDIFTFIRHAHDKGMKTMICTNGSRLTPKYIPSLKEAKIDSVIISIDAVSKEVHEKNRGLKGVCGKIREANRIFKELKIQTTASVTISKLISDYEALPGFLRSLGFKNVTFSYPLEHLSSSYLGFAKSSLVHYSPEELIAVFERIKALKKYFHILNNTVSLSEMQRFLRNEPQDFGCLGGYRYFYVDWNLDVYRCHNWEKPMCKIDEFGPDKFIRDNCTSCMMDCYRDPSVLQHIAVSVTDANRLSKERKYWQATREIFKKTNFQSLRAVLEQVRWIAKM